MRSGRYANRGQSATLGRNGGMGEVSSNRRCLCQPFPSRSRSHSRGRESFRGGGGGESGHVAPVCTHTRRILIPAAAAASPSVGACPEGCTQRRREQPRKRGSWRRDGEVGLAGMHDFTIRLPNLHEEPRTGLSLSSRCRAEMRRASGSANPWTRS